MEYILVSACLLGQNCRYDGTHCDREALRIKLEGKAIVGFCPECAGGMTTPRYPSEIAQGEGLDVIAENACVKNRIGEDVTAPFLSGALEALEICKKKGIRRAYLKEGSPSCGVSRIYDGTFSGKKKPGRGVTCAMLEKHGIQTIGID